jgi:hypothetical protein
METSLDKGFIFPKAGIKKVAWGDLYRSLREE